MSVSYWSSRTGYLTGNMSIKVTREFDIHLSGVNFQALSSFCVCFSFSLDSSTSFAILWNTRFRAGSRSMDRSWAVLCVCACFISEIWFWKRNTISTDLVPYIKISDNDNFFMQDLKIYNNKKKLKCHSKLKL